MKSAKLIVFLLILFRITSHAQAINLELNDATQNIGKKITYFEDKSTVLTLAAVQKAYEKGQFKKGKADILNFGNTPAAIWIHILFTPSTDGTDYLIADAPTLEEIDCYLPSDTGWLHLQAGSIKKASPGVQSTNHFVFTLPFAKQGAPVKTLWLRLKTRNIMLAALKMTSSGNLFLTEKSDYSIIEISLIGIFFTLFAFNLFLFFGIGDRTYLYYCLYVLCFGCYVIGYFAGYGYLLGADARLLLNKYPHIFLCLAFAMAILITNKVYDLRKNAPSLFAVFKYLLAGIGVLLIISLLGFKSLAAAGSQILGLLIPVIMMVCGIIIYRKGKQPMMYFTLAWLAIIVAVIIYVLSLQGIIQYQSYSRLILEVGAIIEFLLLAFALGQRYHLILKKQRETQEENYKLIQSQNLELEKLVEKRTEKLKNTIAMLKASDNIKNKLFSIVAHDLRTPFNSMQSIFSAYNLEALSFEELQLLLNENKKSFFHLGSLLDNLLHWARAQMNEAQTQPQIFDLTEMIRNLAIIYEPIAQRKQLGIEIKGASTSAVYADKDHIQLVLRNLLDNAIKFTPPMHTIDIDITAHGTGAVVHIKNTVTDPKFLARTIETAADQYTPSYGTHNEKGVGLGLNLCRDYLKINNSRLQTSVFETSICFSFELPYPSREKQDSLNA